MKGVTFVLVELPLISPSLESFQASKKILEQEDITLDKFWAPSSIGIYYYVIISSGDVTKIRARMLEPRGR